MFGSADILDSGESQPWVCCPLSKIINTPPFSWSGCFCVIMYMLLPVDLLCPLTHITVYKTDPLAWATLYKYYLIRHSVNLWMFVMQADWVWGPREGPAAPARDSLALHTEKSNASREQVRAEFIEDIERADTECLGDLERWMNLIHFGVWCFYGG